MVHCRNPLPVVHEALPLSLVAAIQLPSRSGTGRWGYHRHVCHILFPANAVEWRHQRQLVGQLCMEEYGGRAVGSSQDPCSG